MDVEFEVGQKYRNRRGEYEVLEISHNGRLKVRYTEGGEVLELERAQQSRIINNIRLEEAYAQALAAKVTPTRSTRASTAKAARSAATGTATRPTTAASRRAAAAAPRVVPSTTAELKPLVPVRREFTKFEVLRLLQLIGYGNADGTFWFIGSGEGGPDDGNITLSERTALPEFQKEFADAAIYKEPFQAELGTVYGNPTWQYTSYIVSRLLLPEDRQTDTARREYFINRFGALDGDVLLTDILPLPAKNFTSSEQWPYHNTTITDSPRYHSVIRDPQKFLDDELLGRPTRLKRLQELYAGLKLQQTAPKYILCHGGRSTWRFYKEIFPQVLNYTEVVLKYQPDREKVARLDFALDSDNGTLILMMPPLTSQEGVTYSYLDMVASLLQQTRR